jgi:pimeloyl-ACP methyl ester carboxylesterase
MRVEIGRISLEVEDHGEGVPLVLLHGFPLSSQMWTPIRAALGEASRAITPDLRGFGDSDKPETGYEMETLASDVLALADRLGLDRFVLGGHSMGGYVAFRVLAAAAGRVAGLVLVDTRAEADDDQGRARRQDSIAAIGRGEVGAFLDGFVGRLVGPSAKTRAPRLLDELRAVAGAASPHALAGCLAGMAGRPDSHELLQRFKGPALVIVGQEDELTPPTAAHAMAADLADAELVVIARSGHTPSVERPIPVAEAMLAFLRRHWPGAAPVRPRGRSAPPE